MGIQHDDFIMGPLKRLLDAIERHVRDESTIADLEREVEAVTGIPLDVIASMPAESAVDMFVDAGRIDPEKAALVGTALRRRADAHRQDGQFLAALRARKAGEALVRVALVHKPELAGVGLQVPGEA